MFKLALRLKPCIRYGGQSHPVSTTKFGGDTSCFNETCWQASIAANFSWNTPLVRGFAAWSKLVPRVQWFTYGRRCMWLDFSSSSTFINAVITNECSITSTGSGLFAFLLNVCVFVPHVRLPTTQILGLHVQHRLNILASKIPLPKPCSRPKPRQRLTRQVPTTLFDWISSCPSAGAYLLMLAHMHICDDLFSRTTAGRAADRCIRYVFRLC